MNLFLTAILGIAGISLLAFLEVKREEKFGQRALTNSHGGNFRQGKSRIKPGRHRS